MPYISYTCEKELHQQLKEHCTKNGWTMREFITRLIKQALNKKQPRKK